MSRRHFINQRHQFIGPGSGRNAGADSGRGSGRGSGQDPCRNAGSGAALAPALAPAQTPVVAPVQTPVQTPVLTADEEAVRRQEQSILLRKKLADAQAAQKRNDLELAVRYYEDAYKLIPDIGLTTTIEPETKLVVSGLIDVRMKIAKEAQKLGRLEDLREADAQVTRVLRIDKNYREAIEFKKVNDRLLAEAKKMSPSDDMFTRVLPEAKKEAEQVDALIQDARFLWELGRLDEAREKLKEALKIDPDNSTAYYYRRLISESDYRESNQRREADSVEGYVEVGRGWEKPIKRETLPVPNDYALTPQVHTSKGRQAIQDKLNKIVLNEVFFDGWRLDDVIKQLDTEAKARDPEHKGINFLLNANIDPPATPALPTNPLNPDQGAGVLDAAGGASGH